VADLQQIPQWSPRYPESQELVANFSQELLKINQVLLALQTAISVEKRNLVPAKNWAELRNRQNLLRQAITQLNTVKPESEFYQLVQGNLPRYENSVNTITQQLIREETWLKKIASAKTLGDAAIKGQATAKSATDWQQVKFDLRTAINTLKTIPQDSFGFQDASKLLAAYQAKIIVADDNAKKEKLSIISSQQVLAIMNQVKTDINKTCTSNIKICTFTIENNKINIRLTVEYKSLLQANNATMRLHFQSLQNALKVISQKYQIPVSIDNSQVQEQ
jgi:ribosomal protein L30E